LPKLSMICPSTVALRVCLFLEHHRWGIGQLITTM